MKPLITRTITIKLARTEKITDGLRELRGETWGYRTVPDGELTGVIELSVDAERLFKQLAEKALRSKGRKARMACGAVEARATCLRRVP